MTDNEKWIDNIRKIFEDASFKIREITSRPNAYRGDGSGLPWLDVQTDTGIIEVGWRRHVMHLGWENAPGIGASASDFSDDVTKADTFIHAWTYDKLGEYLRVLRGNPRTDAAARMYRVKRLLALRYRREAAEKRFAAEIEEMRRAESALYAMCDHREDDETSAAIRVLDAIRADSRRVCTICGSDVFERRRPR